MGCSPSHALIINSPPAQETICLQPRIFMVSESTLCLLKDVGELRVYRVDDRNPETAMEKFKGVDDQLQNPLLFHPQLRNERRGTLIGSEGMQAGGSNSNKAICRQETEEDLEIKNGSIAEELNCGNVDESDDDSESGEEIHANSNAVKSTSQGVESSEYSVKVEVYSYRKNTDEQAGEENEVESSVNENLDTQIMEESTAVVDEDLDQSESGTKELSTNTPEILQPAALTRSDTSVKCDISIRIQEAREQELSS